MRTADLIEQELFEGAIPVGSILASEQALRERYSLGRQAMREALRILQFRGSIRMRRGPNGGLVVCAPPLEHLARRLVGHIGMAGVDLECLRRARVTLSLTALRLALPRREAVSAILRAAPEHLPVPDRGDLSHLSCRARFLVLLCWACGNVALTLFARILASSIERNERWDRDGLGADPRENWLRSCEECIVTALQRGDGDAAAQLLRVYHERLDAILELEHPRGVLRDPPAHQDPLSHRATRLARAIVGSIIQNRVRPGDRLGSEEDLCSAHNAPRATLRQALRILEGDGIVLVRPGRGLGVFVSAPNPQSIVTGLRTFLRARNLEEPVARELLQALGIELSLRAAQSTPFDETVTRKITTLVQTPANNPAALNQLLAWLRELVAGDPVIGQLVDVLTPWCDTATDDSRN